MAPKIASVVAGVPLTFADQLLIQTWLQAAKQEHVWKRACGAAQNDAESSKRSKKSISHDDDGGMEEDAEYEKGDLEVASEGAWERLGHSGEACWIMNHFSQYGRVLWSLRPLEKI